jgi:hypothetical protein
MISALRRLFRADPAQRPSLPETDNRQDRRVFPDNYDVMVARRAERLNNRRREDAAKYVRVQTILKAGLK